MRLYYRHEGQGEPLIILHGLLGSSDNWRAMSKRLAQHFAVYSLDLRNHGQSPHASEMNYTVMGEDLREFIEEHTLARTFLLGHSLGGKIAMQFATTYPGEVEKLIVVDIAPKTYSPSQKPLLAALRALDLTRIGSFSDANIALTPAIPETALRQFLIKNLNRDETGRFRWRIGLDEIAENYDALTLEVALDRPFEKSACFIRGGQSDFIADADTTIIRRTFPRAKIETIARAGHWVQSEAPEEFYRTVVGFLSAPGD
jgi:pimeloyl-ACP methyl ester carboxylesterase